MRSVNLALICMLGFAGTAYAQVPLGIWSGNDVSDNSDNTGMGTNALHSLTAGQANTGSGFQTLINNTTGNWNTASGTAALYFNQTGNYNTAIGGEALEFNSSSNNTAAGYLALNNNSSGSNNTAVGYQALQSSFDDSLGALGSGSNNTAIGSGALFSYTSGSNNTASGWGALQSNTSGSNNIAIGQQAGFNLTTGSNNIDIGNVGLAGESNTIRIGTRGTQKATVIAGIYGTPVSGAAVVVSSTGRLGVTVSSERYKTAISPMGSNTANLRQLRPVTFHLKTDPTGALQYGLIAEEVARVYPDLVIRNEAGRIDGVRYDELAPMLLNEVQLQQRKIAAQDEHTAVQDAKIGQLMMQLAEMHAALDKLQAKDELVAQR
jgi:hypothetical protein